MKISKLVWSILVALVAVGLVAPQQAEAVLLRGSFQIVANLGRITTNQVNTLTLVEGPFLFSGDGDFDPFNDGDVTFTDATMTWTGIGHNVNLIDGFSFNVQGTDDFLLQGGMDTLGFFSGFIPNPGGASARLVGSGLTQVFVNGVLEKEAQMVYQVEIFGSTDMGALEGSTNISATPEGGSTWGLLAIGLVSLVAVERLRRKITSLQNR
jgi:hypothetical protein